MRGNRGTAGGDVIYEERENRYEKREAEEGGEGRNGRREANQKGD